MELFALFVKFMSMRLNAKWLGGHGNYRDVSSRR
jgi:hypothetical protein